MAGAAEGATGGAAVSECRGASAETAPREGHQRGSPPRGCGAERGAAARAASPARLPPPAPRLRASSAGRRGRRRESRADLSAAEGGGGGVVE